MLLKTVLRVDVEYFYFENAKVVMNGVKGFVVVLIVNSIVG